MPILIEWYCDYCDAFIDRRYMEKREEIYYRSDDEFICMSCGIKRMQEKLRKNDDNQFPTNK